MSQSVRRPTVSVVVPSYNRASCLPATVQSILSQTMLPDEVLIVDDGSTDNTAEVCRAFPAPVRYVVQPNGGTGAAKNTGMRQAVGDYIALLDADDVWDPRKLDVQLALHAAHPDVRWSVTNHRTTDGDGRPLPGVQGFARDFTAFPASGLDPDTFFASAMRKSELQAAGGRHVVYTGDVYELKFWGNFAFPSCVMLHRSLMDEVGVFDPDFRVAGDTEYFHRLAAASPLGVIMTPLLLWRRGQANTVVSSANMIRLVRNALVSVDRASTLRGEPSARVRELHRAARRRLLERLAYIQLTELDGGSVRRTLREAWSAGTPRSVRTLGIYGASLLPAPALRALQRIKQGLRP